MPITAEAQYWHFVDPVDANLTACNAVVVEATKTCDREVMDWVDCPHCLASPQFHLVGEVQKEKEKEDLFEFELRRIRRDKQERDHEEARLRRQFPREMDVETEKSIELPNNIKAAGRLMDKLEAFFRQVFYG